MDKNTISVVVESLPSNMVSEILPWATGIILPVALYLISKTFANKAEKSADEFTINLYKEERIHLQKIRVFDLLKNIFTLIHNLKRINLKRKKSEEFAESLLKANDKIIASGNGQAIAELQENIRMIMYRNDDLEDSQVDYTINIQSIIGHLSTIIGDERIEALMTKVNSLIKSANEPGNVTHEMIHDVIIEINSLSDRVISGEIKVDST